MSCFSPFITFDEFQKNDEKNKPNIRGAGIMFSVGSVNKNALSINHLRILPPIYDQAIQPKEKNVYSVSTNEHNYLFLGNKVELLCSLIKRNDNASYVRGYR